MRNKPVKWLFCYFCLVTTWTNTGPLLLGQTPHGSITGIVTDRSGAAIVDAQILLIDTDTGRKFQVSTDAEGRYSVQDIPTGIYDIRVSVAGFKTITVNSVSIAASQWRTVDVVVDAGPPPPPRPPPPPASIWKDGHPPPRSSHKFADPVWNVWAERSATPSFKPQSLQRGLDHTVVVNLAALSYRQFEGEGVYSQDSSASFAEWVERNNDIDSADVEVLVIPDQRYFQMRGENAKPLHIDLKKIRDARKSELYLYRSPFEYLHSHGGEAPFSFGMQFFRLKTMPNAPLGNAPVALSIWADGKPIDEVAVNLCVAVRAEDICPTSSASSSYSLRGVDLSGKQDLPDAALHLIERGSDVVGVFRCNSCGGGGYLCWTIGQQADGWLANRVSEVVQHLTPPVSSQEYFTQAGDVLYNLIFPNSQDPDEAGAEKAFGSFFSAAHAKGPADQPLSLFVRLLSNKPNLVLFPIGLMRAPLPDGSKGFLGLNVNIEAPLELQDYSVPSKCISNWVLFVPPADPNDSLGLGDLADARDYASGWIDLMAKSCPECTYTDPGKFSDWLLGNNQPVTAKASQAVVVLSQYKNNSLFFNGAAENPPSVPSGSIRRTFAAPSFVILDACGTAAPGGSEFIRALNSHGVYSLISTSTAIPGPMGGQFLKIFMELLTKHPEYTVSRARYEAVKTLNDTHGSNDKPYGPQALVFTLVGNGSLHLCMPQR